MEKINRTPLTVKDVGSKVQLNGWVSKSRRLGDLIFVDLRNSRGITQLKFDQSSKFFELANTLRNEFVISIEGNVLKRRDVNEDLPSGDIEIEVTNLLIISKANTTPLIIADKTDALEEVRMKYRYLDLRRPMVQNTLIARSKLNNIVRNFLIENGLIEVETPTITKPTFGGAEEFKFSSSEYPDKFFSLVQSPQIYKQLLMYSGLEGYFQIAKCYRDEKSRSDRQPEFTQLDIEKSFTSFEEIQSLIDELIIKLFNEFMKVDLTNKIGMITYEEAMSRFGCDKPDLRFKNELINLTSILNSSNGEIKTLMNDNNSIGVYIQEDLSNSNLSKIVDAFKTNGTILTWIKYKGGVGEKSNSKMIDESIMKEISSLVGLKDFIIFLTIDTKEKAQIKMGDFRLFLANQFNLIKKDSIEALWVVDFPLFGKDDDGKLVTVHNPFTAPKTIINKEDPSKTISQAYDLVINGKEIGGGSIRINDANLQKEVFEYLGFNLDEMERAFGFMFEAMSYGVPQEGGIALGIDRLLITLLKQDSIRDVIAFPKSSHGTDEMLGAPIAIKLGK